jgi:quercetin dioxygenase-like cupin family protein
MTIRFVHSLKDEAPVLIPAIGLTLRVRVPQDATGGAITSIETENAPRFGPPLHRHRETEIFYVLEGRYLFEVDGTRVVANPGDVISVPGGAAHAFVNLSDAPGRQFIQIVPAFDAEAFFQQLADAMRSGVNPPAALSEFGRKWGVEFLGPPIKAEA